MNPGSIEAQAAGCRCPVIDNNYGHGFPIKGLTKFWISEDCKLHGLPEVFSEGDKSA